MSALSERVEIYLPKTTVEQLREVARQRQVSVSDLVQDAVEFLFIHDQDARRRAAEALFQVEAPVADWSEMEKEIELGFLGIQSNGEK